MRVFQTKGFTKFARGEDLSDAKLCGAIREVEQGQIDADYGGGVLKQRVARQGEGKSGGFRVIVCFRQSHRAFFVHGFAKSEKANLDVEEVKIYKKLAKYLFALSEQELEDGLKKKDFLELECDGENN